MVPRIYLAGRIAIECGSALVEERELPGRQGRLAFAFLVDGRHKPISRDDFVNVVWPDGPPRELEASMSALLSKLRSVLKKVGISGPGTIDVLSRTIQMRLPADTWVDLENASYALDQAEGALRASEPRRAWGYAVAAAIIARRPFLAGEEGPWIEARRARLLGVLVRSLHALSHISAANGEDALAVQYANEVLSHEPFSEPAYRHLMRLHARMGNRAEALRVFAKCRELLRDELGTSPSPESEALFLEILRAE